MQHTSRPVKKALCEAESFMCTVEDKLEPLSSFVSQYSDEILVVLGALGVAGVAYVLKKPAEEIRNLFCYVRDK